MVLCDHVTTALGSFGNVDMAVTRLVVRARRRQKACDAVTCYIPELAQADWALRIVPETVATLARRAKIFGQIAYREEMKNAGRQQAEGHAGMTIRLALLVIVGSLASGAPLVAHHSYC
jgi:hypothetical protein